MLDFSLEDFNKIEQAHIERKQKKDKLTQLVNEKFDKLTDEQIEKLTMWLEERK